MDTTKIKLKDEEDGSGEYSGTSVFVAFIVIIILAVALLGAILYMALWS